MLSKEEWKDIVGYEGVYQVSDHGRVRSLNRTVAGKGNGYMSIKGTILKPRTSKKYFRIDLSSLNKRKSFYVHRLVLSTFNPVPNMDNLEVNHINGNPSDNFIGNLEWTTRQENVNHSYEYNLCRYKRHEVDMFTLEGEYIKSFKTSYRASKETGINRGNIARNCKGTGKSAGGYLWRFSKC